MSQQFNSDPAAVAAAIRGAFAVVAARMEARMDSRLSDNERVADAVCDIVSLTHTKLDGQPEPDMAGDGDEHHPDGSDE